MHQWCSKIQREKLLLASESEDHRSSIIFYYIYISHTVTGRLLSNLARLTRLFRSRLFRSPFVIRPTQFIELDMPTKKTQGGFYAVRTGRKTGVFRTWYVPAT